MTSSQRSKERWILISTLLNVVLAGAKGVWGFVLGGGTVVLAGAAHSASDILGAALVYGAIRWSSHRSERFPFGLYKLEDLAAVTGSLAVVGVAIGILVPLIQGTGIVYTERPWATAIFMLLLAVVQTIFVLMERAAAKRLRSPGLASDAVNWVGDIAADLVVVLGIGVSALGIPYAQEIAILLIGLAVVHSAWPVFRNALWALLDASASDEEVEQVRAIVQGNPAVSRLRRVRVRRAGSMTIIDLTVDMNSATFDSAHQAVDAIEEQLMAKMEGVETVTIHYEPDRPHGRSGRMLEESGQPSLDPAKAPWLEILEDGVVLRRVPNPASGSEVALAGWLIRNGVDTVELPEGATCSSFRALLEEMDFCVGVCEP